MAYEKNSWQDSPSTATPITAEKLNRIEEGIFNANKIADENKTAVSDNEKAIKSNKEDIDKLKTTKLNYTDVIQTGGDLNSSSYLTSGVYQFKGAKLFDNLPENFGNSPIQGTLVVLNGQLTYDTWCIVQMFIGQLNIYQRRYTYNEKFGSGSWNNWVKVATDEDIKEIVTQGIDDETIKQAVEESVGTILEDKENVSNKVQTIFMPSESYYPSVKAVWDFVLAHLEDKEDVDNKTTSIDDTSTDMQYPSAKAVRTFVNNKISDVKIEQPAIVDSVAEMTDKSKQYVLQSTGTLWTYKESTTKETVTESITGLMDNTGISGDNTVTAEGYVCTPLFNLGKYDVPFTLHLEGANWYPTEKVYRTRCTTYDTSGTQIKTGNFSSVTTDTNQHWDAFFDPTYCSAIVGGDLSIALTFQPPARAKTGVNLGNVRFSAIGTSANAEVYISYEQEVTKQQWTDTDISYGVGGTDAETMAKVSALNNEGSDPTTIKLLSKPVLDFYNSSAYSDDDYTTSHLSKITYPCRADMPLPFTVKWPHNENAMRTTVAVDTKVIGTNNAYTLKTYNATGLDSYPIYNLLPNTIYYYKITHILSDGSLVEAKSGSFATSGESIRLLYIDGTQNVRDLGGWTGLDGKKVKYGKLFRGASFSDTSYPELMLTGKGRLALAELKVQAELNLGAVDTKTEIGQNCAYKKLGISNYATVITDATQRGYIKIILEYIVSCLNGTLTESGLPTVARNIYFHCQGGCDRTGTLSFILLGLLGVSESDLAKEYELSSFSDVGYGRLRTTTKSANTYDYVGMVEALKTYNGDTITDKFYNFAITSCGISADTIATFRNLMLE